MALHGLLADPGQIEQQVEGDDRGDEEHQDGLEQPGCHGADPVPRRRQELILIVRVVEERLDVVVRPQHDGEPGRFGKLLDLARRILVERGEVGGQRRRLLGHAGHHEKAEKHDPAEQRHEGEKRTEKAGDAMVP